MNGPQRSPLDPARRKMLLASASALLGTAAALRPANAAAPQRPDWIALPRMPDAALIDQEGHELCLLSDVLEGKKVAISFMFTGCATVCPPQTALLQEALRQMRERAGLKDVRMVALTVDPLGDGPKQLRDYARRFDLPLERDGGWTLLTGHLKQIGPVLKSFGVAAGAPNDHPSVVWIGDEPSGRWTRTSSLNPPETVVRLFEALL